MFFISAFSVSSVAEILWFFLGELGGFARENLFFKYHQATPPQTQQSPHHDR